MKITSSAFEQGNPIPSKYTCDGDNVSVPLSFSGVPSDAKSLVLIMDDPDIPDFVKEKFGIDKFDHWVLFNIPPSTTGFAEGTASGVHGNNSKGDAAYTGPCPPDREHRYLFILYALDITLDLSKGSSKEQVLAAIQGHILSEATLMGTYERQQ